MIGSLLTRIAYFSFNLRKLPFRRKSLSFFGEVRQTNSSCPIYVLMYLHSLFSRWRSSLSSWRRLFEINILPPFHSISPWCTNNDRAEEDHHSKDMLSTGITTSRVSWEWEILLLLISAITAAATGAKMTHRFKRLAYTKETAPRTIPPPLPRGAWPGNPKSRTGEAAPYTGGTTYQIYRG